MEKEENRIGKEGGRKGRKRGRKEWKRKERKNIEWEVKKKVERR